jgi:catalase-peroxidase
VTTDDTSRDEPGPVATTDEERAPAATCPVMHNPHVARGATANQHWWPNQLNLRPLSRNSPLLDPMDGDFDYGAAFETLDLAEVKADIERVMTTSQDWWPADYGHYGPLFIRMAWHSAGTYRIHDGRGGASTGTQRFAPLNSWPDNANLDKARRLLWPVKQKYGRRLSWADLLILAGNVALESMGFRTFGFGGGREDVWEPEEDIHWGPEDTWLADRRHDADGRLLPPFGADQMGLIYVNPEGPNGVPDPLEAARYIRTTFANMAMDDTETVALIAGGHTFGKAHGAADADRYVGPEPEAAPLEEQGLGWRNTYGTGVGADTITSGLEGAWTTNPTRWDTEFLEHLFRYEWELTRSPAGAYQWRPTDRAADGTVPDAHDPTKRHAPIMLTTDLALRVDPVYEPIARRFLEHPDEFADAFARAWFKLTHRDMGPIARYRGPEVPTEPLIWQDPVPAADHPLVGDDEVEQLKRSVLDSGLRIPQLVRVAWASASTYRDSDKRGGANGARIRLAPQRDWEVNDPAELAEVLGVLERVRSEFNASAPGGARISLADLVVLAGSAAVEAAARAGGVDVVVPFHPGRTDATQEWTDVQSFAVLEPTADGFRNWFRPGDKRRQEELLVDRAAQLTLTPPELTVLIGGLRALGATVGDRPHGVLTDRPGVLTNDFFVNLLDLDLEWRASGEEHLYEGVERRTGRRRWTATAVDLVFGSNSQLRALAEVYASADAAETFVTDFVAAWVKVMELDRFDLRRR